MERPVSDIKVDDEDVYIKELTTSELLSLMESKKLFEAVDKLHYFRRVWRNEAFGQSDEDDLDVLFYMYAHHIAEKQEGPGWSTWVCIQYAMIGWDVSIICLCVFVCGGWVGVCTCTHVGGCVCVCCVCVCVYVFVCVHVCSIHVSMCMQIRINFCTSIILAT